MIHHSIEVHRSSIDKHFQLAFNPHHPTTALHPAMPSVYEPELSLPQSNEAFFFTASAMASRSASSRRRWRSTLISWQLRSIGALLTKKSWTLCWGWWAKILMIPDGLLIRICMVGWEPMLFFDGKFFAACSHICRGLFHNIPQTSLACLLIFCSKTI